MASRSIVNCIRFQSCSPPFYCIIFIYNNMLMLCWASMEQADPDIVFKMTAVRDERWNREGL